MGIAVVFPGQGSQSPDMATPWASHPVGREVLDLAADVLGRDVVEGCHDPSLLSTTAFVQPALLAVEVAAWRVLESAGLRPIGTAGHSLGEFSALVAAGVLDLADAVGLVRVRGEAMQRASAASPGGMVALLGVGPGDASALCEEARGGEVLVVANENSPQQVVVSGSVGACERLEALARARSVRAVRLAVAGAFHSELMAPALDPLRDAIEATTFHPPRFPVASNVTGDLVDDALELRALLVRHVVSPVRWQRCVATLVDAGADTFVEAGPGDVLTKLAKRTAPGSRAIAVGDPEAAAASVTG